MNLRCGKGHRKLKKAVFATLLLFISIHIYFHYINLNSSVTSSTSSQIFGASENHQRGSAVAHAHSTPISVNDEDGRETISTRLPRKGIKPITVPIRESSNDANKYHRDSAMPVTSIPIEAFDKYKQKNIDALAQSEIKPIVGISPSSLNTTREHYQERASSGTKVQHQISTDVKLHIAFCIFGVVGRAIEWTWPTMNTHLIEPLESAGFRVTIYVFNMQVGSTKVDNNYLNATAYRTIYSSVGRVVVYEEEDQHGAEVTKAVASVMRSPNVHLYSSNRTSVNALRKMYSEMRVGQYLERNMKLYDLAIATSADHGYIFHIPLTVVREAASQSASNLMYLGSHLVSGLTGIDDGFYMGRPEVLARFMQRFNDIPGPRLGDLVFSSENVDQGLPAYEVILNRSIMYHNVTARETPMVAFYKVRSDGWVQIVGSWFLGRQRWMSEENRTFALSELYRIKQWQSLRPDLEASEERLEDNQLQLTESAKRVVREAIICSFKGDLRELPPTKRKLYTRLQSQGICFKYVRWKKKNAVFNLGNDMGRQKPITKTSSLNASYTPTLKNHPRCAKVNLTCIKLI